MYVNQLHFYIPVMKQPKEVYIYTQIVHKIKAIVPPPFFFHLPLDFLARTSRRQMVAPTARSNRTRVSHIAQRESLGNKASEK